VGCLKSPHVAGRDAIVSGYRIGTVAVVRCHWERMLRPILFLEGWNLPGGKSENDSDFVPARPSRGGKGLWGKKLGGAPGPSKRITGEIIQASAGKILLNYERKRRASTLKLLNYVSFFKTNVWSEEGETIKGDRGFPEQPARP